MQNSLITVFNGQIANQSVQLANARTLHEFLESDRQFANWITDRITDYGFVQDEDYIIVTERTNGRPRKEYHITLDMGKELAMVERNEKGRQIRKYFIECERRANSQKIQPNLPLEKPALPRKAKVRYDEYGWRLYDRELSSREMEFIIWGWFEAHQRTEFLKELLPALEAIQSGFYKRAHMLVNDLHMLNTSGDMLYQLVKGTDVMELAPLITLKKLHGKSR